MNEERNKWSKQLSSNFGAKEFLRFGCAVMIWLFIGLAISIPIGVAGYSWASMIFVIFLSTILVFPFVTRRWKPAYSLLRKILGNKNLPSEPMPYSIVKIPRQPLPWWGYLFGIWFLLLDLLILYIILKRH